jgi:hypothetical protein
VVVEPVDDHRLTAWQTRFQKFHTISACTPIVGVWRQYMHQHIVVGFSVVSHQPEHLDLDCPLPRWWPPDAQVAFPATTLRIRDIGLHDVGVPSSGQVLKLGRDEGDGLRLGMWTNSRLVNSSSPDVGSLETSSVTAFDGSSDIVA